MGLSLGSIDIKSWSLGGCYVREAYLGSIQIWPAAGITTAITNAHAVYSEGTKLNAAGTNYAIIQGTLHYYSGGTEIYADSGATFYLSGTSSNEFIQNGMTVTSPNLGTVGTAERTETWYGYIVPGNLTAAVNITRELNGIVSANTAGEFKYVTGRNNINAITDTGSTQEGGYYGAFTITLVASMVRRNIYTSGAYTEGSSNQFSARTDGSSWLSLTRLASGGDYRINVSALSQTGTTRVGYVEFWDRVYPSVTTRYTVIQGEPIWVLVPSPFVSLEYEDTGFYVSVESSCSGNPYYIKEEMITVSGLTGVDYNYTEYVSGNTYNVHFTCEGNYSANANLGWITFTQPYGRPRTTTIVHNAETDAPFSGISVFAATNKWVFGTITAGSGYTSGGGGIYYSNGIVAARINNQFNSENLRAEKFEYEYQAPVTGSTPSTSGATPFIYQGNSSNTLVITPLGFSEPKTYYGRWVITPYPNQKINILTEFRLL